jgi:hypothetical protein
MVLLLLGASWLVIFALFPEFPYRVAPSRLRTNRLWGVGGWPLLIVMLAIPLALMFLSGYELGVTETDSGLALAIFFGVLLGGPGAAVSFRSWRIQRELVRSLLPAVDLGLLDQQTPARLVRPAGPSPVAPSRPRTRSNWHLRRARTVLLALAVVSYVLARLTQGAELLGGRASNYLEDAIFGTFCFCAVVGCGLTLVLRARHHRAGRGSSVRRLAVARGWRTTKTDSGQLATRFPQLPLLQPIRPGLFPTRGVIWGVAADRRWWAADQVGGELGAGNLANHVIRRSMVIVSLPEASLPLLVVSGRDLVRVRDWLDDSMLLESEDWNRRIWVWCRPEDSRYAHAVLHPRAMEHLMATLPDGMAMVVAGDALAVWRDDPLIASDLEAALHCALGMADLLPGFVLNDYTSTGA